MELRRYFDVVVRRKWVIVLTTLAVLAVVFVGSRLQQPIYAASATIRVAQAPGGSLDYASYLHAERLMNTYREILRSRPFLEEVRTRLALSQSPDDLGKQIKVEVLLNTELLKVTAEDPSPVQAERIANALASLLVNQSQQIYYGGAKSARDILQEQLGVLESKLEQDRTALQKLVSSAPQDQEAIDALTTRLRSEEEVYANLLRQYEEARIEEATRASSVTIIEPAVRPDRPSKPRIPLYLALGLLVGLISGVALAFLLEMLDPKLHSASDLEAIIGVPILTSVPEVRTSPLLLRHGASRYGRPSPVSEAYNILRSSIWAGEVAPKAVLVTSAEPDAGKSTVVANLAVALARAGKTVIVTDGDFRRPLMHRLFGVRPEPGVGDVLRGLVSLQDALQQTRVPEIRVLASGQLPATRSPKLLNRPDIGRLLRELVGQADVVLIDSAPVLAAADTAVLASVVDGVLVVASRNQATAARLTRALQQINRVGAKLLGAVFNRAREHDADYYYAYAEQRSRAGTLLIARRAIAIGLILLLSGIVLGTLVVSVAGFPSSVSLPWARRASPTASPGSWTPAAPMTGVVTPSALVAPGASGQSPTSASVRSATPVAIQSTPGVAPSSEGVVLPAEVNRTATADARATQELSVPGSARSPSETMSSPAVTRVSPTTTASGDRAVASTPRVVPAGAGTMTPQPRSGSGGSAASTGTAPSPSPGVGGPIPVAGTPTPVTPGVIVTDPSGLSTGGFLLRNPYQENSGILWLENGSQIAILEDRVYGPVTYGTNLWYLVRYVSDGKTYVGYVPAAIVAR